MKKLLQILAVLLMSFTAFSQTARVQVIHNSADAAAAVVDVYVDDGLALPDFAFRTASPFVDLPAGVEIELSIAPGNSADVNDALLTVPVTLVENETYIVIADGVVVSENYNPAPPLGLSVYAMGREAASEPENVDVLVHHGSTDAPTVDVYETSGTPTVIVDDLAYTDFQGYLELPASDYVLEIRDETGTVGVAAYGAPLETLQLTGVALVVVASGFLNPSENNDGPAFGLWAASPLGGPLLELPSASLGVEDRILTSFSMYPNPTSSTVNINLNEEDASRYNISITDVLGRIVYYGELNANTNSINVSSLNSGVYNVTISNGSQNKVTKKLIKR